MPHSIMILIWEELLQLYSVGKIRVFQVFGKSVQMRKSASQWVESAILLMSPFLRQLSVLRSWDSERKTLNPLKLIQMSKSLIITATHVAAWQWVVCALLSFFVVTTIILLFILFRIKRREMRLREKISQQLRNKRADDERLSKTLNKVMQMVIGIMDCVSLSPENATLLHSKVRSYFLTTLRDKSNIFYDMDYLADKCHYGLITRLKEEHPLLTKDDVCLLYTSYNCLMKTFDRLIHILH